MRYLDMVRECARGDGVFGVCLIMDGQEAGEPALPAAVGTLARIVDFDTLPDGLLGISVTGCTRFHVQKSRIRGNGLVTGEVRHWPDEPAIPINRKSTRLNSSHPSISYAVFCLKKKK